jgi:iron complex transport system substrate-binding protein
MRVAIAALIALLAAAVPPAAGRAEPPPARVVSINLCTDQLALLIADPGQIVSLSHVATDPVSSAMAAEAAAYPANRGSAEEVHLLAPDLVLAGAFDPPATLAMLRRLGHRVETFPLETGFADIRAHVTRMGALLGHPERAARLIAGMDAILDMPPPDGPRPRAALFYANAYSSGTGTLADAILEAAGFANVAAERGLTGLVRLPLEALVMEAPDLVVTGQDYATPARAQEVLRHPAARAVGGGQAIVADNLWVCGTPLAARAVEALRDARARLVRPRQ